MDCKKLIDECRARAEAYRRQDAVGDFTHEEQCAAAIADLLARADSAALERNAAVADLKRMGFCCNCIHRRVDEAGSLQPCALDGVCRNGSEWAWHGPEKCGIKKGGGETGDG